MEDEAEIRRQILQLEFQHKKDMVEMRETQEKAIAEIHQTLDQIAKLQKHTQKHLNHITKLTGIAFEDLESHNQKMQGAGEILSRQK